MDNHSRRTDLSRIAVAKTERGTVGGGGGGGGGVARPPHASISFPPLSCPVPLREIISEGGRRKLVGCGLGMYGGSCLVHWVDLEKPSFRSGVVNVP